MVRVKITKLSNLLELCLEYCRLCFPDTLYVCVSKESIIGRDGTRSGF